MFSEKLKNGRWLSICALAMLSALIFMFLGCKKNIDENSIESNKIGTGEVFSTDDGETTSKRRPDVQEPTEPPTTTRPPATTPEPTEPPTQPPTTTQPPATTPEPTEPPTQPPTTVTQTNPPAPPAPIKISTPTAPGTATASKNGYIVDYSNASQGYIMVKGSDSYSGVIAVQIYKDSTGGTLLTQYVAANTGGYITFPLTGGSGKYSVRVMEQRTNGYSPQLTKDFDVSISSETSPYIYPTYLVNFSSSSLAVSAASQACAGCNTDEEKVLAVKNYVMAVLEYDYSKKADVEAGNLKFYTPNADSVLSAGKGICYDYSALFAAMLRCQGIPVRLVKGYAGNIGYHAWNEAYYNGGWHTIDCTCEDGGSMASSYTVTSYD